MGAMASQITRLTIVNSLFIQAQIKENIQAPRHWPLYGDSPVAGEFPVQMVSHAEDISIWWRHHGIWIEYNAMVIWYQFHIHTE